MAVTFALLASSSNILKYSMTSGGAENADLSAAGAGTPDLLTDCPRGPLWDLINATYDSQAAARTAFLESAAVSIRILPRDADANWIIDANIIGGAGTRVKFNLASAAADGSTGSILTIEHRHSEIR